MPAQHSTLSPMNQTTTPPKLTVASPLPPRAHSLFPLEGNMIHELKDTDNNEKLWRFALWGLKEMYLKPRGFEMDCLTEALVEQQIFGLLIPIAASWIFVLKRRLAQKRA